MIGAATGAPARARTRIYFRSITAPAVAHPVDEYSPFPLISYQFCRQPFRICRCHFFCTMPGPAGHHFPFPVWPDGDDHVIAFAAGGHHEALQPRIHKMLRTSSTAWTEFPTVYRFPADQGRKPFYRDIPAWRSGIPTNETPRPPPPPAPAGPLRNRWRCTPPHVRQWR